MKTCTYLVIFFSIVLGCVHRSVAMEDRDQGEIFFDTLQDWQAAELHKLFSNEEFDCLSDEKLDELSHIADRTAFLAAIKKLKAELPILYDWQAAIVHKVLTDREFASLSKKELFALRAVTDKNRFADRIEALKEALVGYSLNGLSMAAVEHLDIRLRAGLRTYIDRINVARSHLTPAHVASIKRRLQHLMGESEPMLLGAVREGHATVLKCMFAFFKKQCVDDITRNTLSALPKTRFDFEGTSVTLLHIAAASGYDDIVEYLLDQRFDVDVRDEHDATPLHWAARHGQRSTVQLLLDRGADVDAHDELGRTPLVGAVDEGHRVLAQDLINSQASVKVFDQQTQKGFKIPGQSTSFFSCFTHMLKRNGLGDNNNATAA